MSSLKEKPMDSFASWKLAQQLVEQGVKRGELSEKEARSILDEARKNYRNQSYNKALAKRGMLCT